MPQKKRFQTRLDPDVGEQVTTFADDHDITESEALRRLIKRGLDADEPDVDEIRRDLQQIQAELADDRDDDHETHAMHQMGAKRIGSFAAGLGAVGLVYTQLPATLDPVALVALLVVGVALVGYGTMPLFRDASPTQR